MNKIYLGETEVANVGSGGGGGVSDASFNELARVTASALLDLKGLEDNIEEFDDKIEGHVETIDTQIQTLDANKPDSSIVYTKKDIDNADKVTAAALASLDGRVSELEEGGGGGGITPQQLDASLKAYTYDKTFIDASIHQIDVSINALEQGGGGGGITPQQLDASLKAYTYDKAHIDASLTLLDTSIQALDASALSFDASIKELAQGGGGGGTSPFEYIDTKYAIINKDSLYNANAQLGKYAVILNGYNYSYNYTKATGMYSIAGGESAKATGYGSVALGAGAVASGEKSVAIGSDSEAIGIDSVALG